MQAGALLAALLLADDAAPPLPPCAANTESCCVLRALPHFGQAIFSPLESTSFS